jgi:hypothetical protein
MTAVATSPTVRPRQPARRFAMANAAVVLVAVVASVVAGLAVLRAANPSPQALSSTLDTHLDLPDRVASGRTEPNPQVQAAATAIHDDIVAGLRTTIVRTFGVMLLVAIVLGGSGGWVVAHLYSRSRREEPL